MISTYESVKNALDYIGHTFKDKNLTIKEYILDCKKVSDFNRLREYEDKKKTLKLR